MAEFLAFLGIGGGTSGLATALANVLRTIINNVRKGLHLIAHYIRVVIHYIFIYLGKAYNVALKFYDKFMEDPLKQLQVIGTFTIFGSSIF